MFGRRQVPPTAKIHASVKDRMKLDPRYRLPCCRYCKKRLPADSWADSIGSLSRVPVDAPKSPDRVDRAS
jgi:hypothetical protein